MKSLIIIGVLVAVFGLFIVFKDLSYRSHRDVVNVGGFQASVEEHRTIPPWIGGIAIAGGAALVVGGFYHGQSGNRPTT